MKKTIVIIIAVVALLTALSPKLLGFSVFHLGHALQVATSMSAKLACSSVYVSGLDKQTAFSDLSSYSPATKLVKLDYSETHLVNASLLGLSYAEAKYREGLGCSLVLTNEIGEAVKLDDISVPNISKSTLAWPLGETVETIDTSMQLVLDNIVKNDNKWGFITRAMLVVKNGKIVAEAYGNDITSDTKLLGWSMTKSVTAILIARMQQLKLVSENPNQLFPQWSDKRGDIRLQQMLNMASGLEFDETYAPGTDATHMLFTAYSASDVAITSPIATFLILLALPIY